MKLALTVFALVVPSLPAAAQTSCGTNATVSVEPAVAMPGQPVLITIRNTSNQTIQLPTSCVYESIHPGGSCSGTPVFAPFCQPLFFPLGPGQTRTQPWFQTDNNGQPVPPGIYSVQVSYWNAGLTQKTTCCASFQVACPTTTYCTAGTSASGCQALIQASGTPSASAGSGFVLQAAPVEGGRNGMFFFGTNGRQAVPWGNGTSFRCVVPPVTRTTVLAGSGTPGTCGGALSFDLNAHWCPGCPKPGANPGAGAQVQAQLWYRDPQNTSNRTTSFSDAVEFCVRP